MSLNYCSKRIPFTLRCASGLTDDTPIVSRSHAQRRTHDGYDLLLNLVTWVNSNVNFEILTEVTVQFIQLESRDVIFVRFVLFCRDVPLRRVRCDGETWVTTSTPLAVAGAGAARHRSATRGTARALRAVHCLGARTTLRVTTRSEAHVLYLSSVSRL